MSGGAVAPMLAGMLRLALLAFLLLAAPAHGALGPVPAGWPAGLQIGVADGPGGADDLRGIVGVRYQYLAGGVNTGGGWATWNTPPGAFAEARVGVAIGSWRWAAGSAHVNGGIEGRVGLPRRSFEGAKRCIRSPSEPSCDVKRL
jgi:hypothetical protein